MARKAKGPGFTQRSGKSPAFKMIGSSPARLYNPTDQTLAYSGTKEEVEAKHQKFLENLPGWGVATGLGSGGYTDRYGQTATTGIDEFDAKVRSAKAGRRRDASRRFNTQNLANNQPSNSSPSIDKDDFWSQYSF